MNRNRYVLIGSFDQPEFHAVRSFLALQPGLSVAGEFRNLPAAVGPAFETAAIFVICQSWSDEFPRADVTRLIGQTVKSHVLCCLGAWCASDGRSSDLWPVALRTPVTDAISVLEQILARIRLGLPPVSVVASAEDVFRERAIGCDIR